MNELYAELDTLRASNAQLLAALQDMRDAYQRNFDVMPIAWQTYDEIAAQAIRAAKGGG